MCEIPYRLGHLFQTNKIRENKVFEYGFRDTKTKPKKHHCLFQLKDHQIVESAGPQTKKSKRYALKSVGFNFAAFLEFLGMIPVT